MKKNTSSERERLPVDPLTGEQLEPRIQPGYYPGYSTLSQQAFWDAATRAVVLERLKRPPPIRLFSPEEAHAFEIVCSHVLPQDDRDPAHRIPVVPLIDRRLYEKQTDGYRFEDMPPDGDAHRLGLKAIRQMARELFGRDFPELTWLEQEQLLKSIHDGEPKAGQNIWKRLPVHRYWALLVQDCVAIYYAHPWSWDEIGYGGPAYPRAYMRLERGEPEPWEVEESRYSWKASSFCLSDCSVAEGAKNRPEAMRAQGRSPWKVPVGKGFKPRQDPRRHLGAMQRLSVPMRRYSENEAVDYLVVGVGSAGGVLVQRLARAGFHVLGLEAGPFWDTERDWVSDEAGSHKLYWEDLRITGGENPVTLGANNSGKGVGGGSVHWAGFAPRFHPSDFRVYSEDGVGADWPISYQDLKPYYELLELEMPVSGPALFPWGDPHGYPFGPHPMGGVGNLLIRGCTKLGIRVCAGGPVAILSGSRGERPHCIYRGFCLQGCKVGAKASKLITHVPDAIENGAEIRDRSMATRIRLNKNGRADGVSYYDYEGREYFQKAKAVIVAGYAIETPRLLLNSACRGHENGLANSSDTVGRYLMVQAGNVILGRFEEPVRMYKAPPAHAMTEEFYETDRKRVFVRGFAIQTISPLPISFAKHMMAAKGVWGWGMRRVMMDYNHWAAFGLLGEILPWPDNRVTLAQETDQFGLPVAKITFSLHENDKKLIDFGKNKVMEVMRAAGAREVVQEPRYAHLVGGARMGPDPNTSVVDGFGRTHDIPNLFVCDGSILPTQGSANPGLTIQALAARTADYLIWQQDAIFTSNRRDLTRPPVRRDLSPPGTRGAGIPR